MTMKYIGKDGSLGFETGRVYQVKTKMEPYNGQDCIWVNAEGILCPYSSMEKLLENWEIIR